MSSRWWVLLVGALVGSSTAVGSASAQVPPAPAAGPTGEVDLGEPPSDVTPPSDLARFLPGAVAPSAEGATASGLGWAGYDAAARAPLIGAAAEARLSRRLVLGVSATYTMGNDQGRPAALRPRVGARFQVLDQERHGVDAGVSVAYRADRFTDEEGLFEGTVAFGHRFRSGSGFASLAYGQDGEGDDREGEVRLAWLGRVARQIHLGLDGRFRKLLGSSDRNRFAHGTPSYEYAAGPVLMASLGPWTAVVEAGLSGLRVEAARMGAFALGGVGTRF